MVKRKQLPNLRREYTWPEEPDKSGKAVKEPTPEDIAALGQRHGFPADFDLGTRIEESWEWWRVDLRAGRSPNRSDRLKLLKGIAARAEELKEALDLMGVLERELIATSSSDELDLFQLRESCQSLQSAAIVATARVPPSRVGRGGDPYSIELLCGLFRTWVEAFGPNAARITKTEAYGGLFFNFAEDVFRLFGIKKTNPELGRAIEAAISAIKRKEAGFLSPNHLRMKR